MRFDIITLFPSLFDALRDGIIGRAIDNQKITLFFWNPRDFAEPTPKDEMRGECERATGVDTPVNEDCEQTFNEADRFSRRFRRVDDRPYGGGPGMIMQYQPLHDAITAAKNADKKSARVIYLSPQGKLITQSTIRHCANISQRLILIAGRYEGIDERLFIHDIDEEWSIGDYVLSGGELPVMVLIDAITRLLPGTLGDPDSAAKESFENGLLDYPHYSRPDEIDGLSAPAILQSGNHEAISTWRLQQSLGKTWQKRPDLLKRRVLSEDEKNLLKTYIDEAAKEIP